MSEDASGGYELRDRLGRGGMAEVHRALHVALNREVAVKRLECEDGADEEMRARFRREARTLAALSHPNLVKVLDVGELSGRPFLAMELIEGPTLAELIGGDPHRTRARADELFAGILAGVAHLHANGLVHRDLKPGNVMITREGRVVVMDLGLVKDMQRVQTLIATPGTTLGTPAYMAPELLQDDPEVGYAVDVWALGCIYFEMIAGRRAFVQPALERLLADIMSHRLPDLDAALAPDRQHLRAYLESLLARRPQDRPRDAGEALRQLNRALGRPTRPSPVAPRSTGRRAAVAPVPAPRGRPALVAAVSLAAALGVVAAVLALVPRPAPPPAPPIAVQPSPAASAAPLTDGERDAGLRLADGIQDRRNRFWKQMFSQLGAAGMASDIHPALHAMEADARRLSELLEAHGAALSRSADPRDRVLEARCRLMYLTLWFSLTDSCQRGLFTTRELDPVWLPYATGCQGRPALHALLDTLEAYQAALAGLDHRADLLPYLPELLLDADVAAIYTQSVAWCPELGALRDTRIHQAREALSHGGPASQLGGLAWEKGSGKQLISRFKRYREQATAVMSATGWPALVRDGILDKEFTDR